MTIARCALAALLLAACGRDPTTLAMFAAPKSIDLKPGAYATLTVTGTYDGDPLYDGLEVSFETDAGSFAADDAETKSASVSTAGQRAVARLYAPTLVAVAHVTATLVDPYGTIVVARTQVDFRTATDPVRVNLECTSKNIGVLFPDVGDVFIRCRAAAVDARGQNVDGADIRFLAEAGRVVPGDGPGLFLYRPLDGGKKPVDVEPLGEDKTGEPRWTDASGRVRNPRDGLVTLVAYVKGKPSGLFATPWVDANDNELFDAGETLPPDAKDWQGSQDDYVWAQVRLVWSGPLFVGATASRVTGGAAPIARGERRVLDCTLLDQNLNGLAANGADDALSFSTTAPVTLSPDLRRLSHGPGIALTDDGKLRNGGEAASYRVGATYSVTVLNDRAAEDKGELSLLFSGLVTRSLVTDDLGLATQERTENDLPAQTLTLK
ncbi:MAG: hypothetical protein RL199_99 [Pseudomonadota bacterium]|jgi:hypothetical protein